jgi:thiamine pyrophosphate-dependent acetolactate synthase large subunit-like protein
VRIGLGAGGRRQGCACRLSRLDGKTNRTAGPRQFRRGDRVAARQPSRHALLCNGAGNYAAWLHRFFRFRRFGQHVASASGSMGYGVSAVVAMKRLYPDRPVICLAGDGDFLMNGQESATAVQHDLPIITIIFDNGMYGTIRMHQEREYAGRISATKLRNPDFPAYARAFGSFGISVERTEDFPAAFAEAQASGKPAIIRLVVDPEAITPATTLPRQSADREKSVIFVILFLQRGSTCWAAGITNRRIAARFGTTGFRIMEGFCGLASF